MNKLMIGVAALAVAVPALAQVSAPLAPPPPPPTAAPYAPHAPRAPMAARVQTRDQVVAKVRDHFARLDTNRDGFVAGDELQAMRGHRGGLRDHRTAAAFEWLDQNRDNMISRSEFTAGRAVRGERMGGRGTAVAAMPGDRPRMRMQRMGGGHGMGGGGMMRMADLDRDGRVSLQEATTSALQHFDQVDVNRDGQITPDERRSMRHKMREGRGRRG